MAQQTLSLEVLIEHHDNYEARLSALRSGMDDEIEIFYRNTLRSYGFEVGDHVAFHNSTYYITDLAIITHEGRRKFIEFGVRRYSPDSGSIRWLILDALDEFTKIEE